jgi:hypothetical protein
LQVYIGKMAEPDVPHVAVTQTAQKALPQGTSLRQIAGWGIFGIAAVNFTSVALLKAADGEVAALVALIGAEIYFAEIAAATLWVVWGPGPFVKRLLVLYGVGIVLYLAWAIAFVAAFRDRGPPGGILQFCAAVLCSLPPVCLAAQLPLWPLRIYLGWRIERNESLAPRPQALSIADVLASTAVAAVNLAAIRLIPADYRGGSQFWVGWGIAGVSIAGASAVLLIPALLYFCQMQSPGGAIAAWIVHIGAVFAFAVAAFSIFTQINPPGDAIVLSLIGFYAFGGALAIPLLVVHSHGYRLSIPSSRRPASK